MINRRIILSRFCATLSAGALALALASPAWSADTAGQAEIQLAKNHINSLKKPMPALSGKALQAFKNREKAFQASTKQKPPKPTGPKAISALSGKALEAFKNREKEFNARAKQKPTKPLTRKQMMDGCQKDKECREQMIFIQKEMKKKKSGSLDFGWPDLASVLNPFQIKEAQAAHLPTLFLTINKLGDVRSTTWYARLAGEKPKRIRMTELIFNTNGYVTVDLMVPKTGWYLTTFIFHSWFGMTYEYSVDGLLTRTGTVAPRAARFNFESWSYLAAGSHIIMLRAKTGGFEFYRANGPLAYFAAWL